MLNWALIFQSLKCNISSAAETFTHTDSELLKADTTHNRDAGSTASTAILVGDRLVVANVGDSRAVICRGGDGKLRSTSFWDEVSCNSYYPPLPLGETKT